LIIEKKDNIYFFKPSGELTSRTETDIRKEIIDTLVDDPDFLSVNIILRDISYIDSNGIGMLIYINKLMTDQCKNFHLISPSRSVLDILMLGSFDKIFKIKIQ
jgi:anti-anti-sigma factor